MTNPTRPYHQLATQRERADVLRNDKRVASTFLDHTHNDDEGGIRAALDRHW
jgi:hypothetical protein